MHRRKGGNDAAGAGGAAALLLRGRTVRTPHSRDRLFGNAASSGKLPLGGRSACYRRRPLAPTKSAVCRRVPSTAHGAGAGDPDVRAMSDIGMYQAADMAEVVDLCGHGEKQLDAITCHDGKDRMLAMLWDKFCVPEWHRELFIARYMQQKFLQDVVRREVDALLEKRALVQEAMCAVEKRERVLQNLVQVRLRHDDDHFRRPGSPARRILVQAMLDLREATVGAIEAVASWRSFVAPLPGRPRCTSPTSQGLSGCAPPIGIGCTVAGPVARGALWPWPPTGEDYLWVIAHNDSVVQAFDTVLHISRVCDPLLLTSNYSNSQNSSKIQLPPVHSSNLQRTEAAKIRLLEEEIMLAVFAGRRTRVSTSVTGDSANCQDMASLPATVRAVASAQVAAEAGLGNDTINVAQPVSTATMVNEAEVTAAAVGVIAASAVLPPAVGSASKRPASHNDYCRHATSRRGRLPSGRSAAGDNGGLSVLWRPLSAAPAYCPVVVPNETMLLRKLPLPSDLPSQKLTSSQTATETDIDAVIAGTAAASNQTVTCEVGGQTPNSKPPVQSSPRERKELVASSFPPTSTADTCRLPLTARNDSSSFSSSSSGAPSMHGVFTSVVTPEKIQAVFRRFGHDGCIHCDDVTRAINACGVIAPNHDWIMDVFKQITNYSTIRPHEFQDLVTAYDKMATKMYYEEFQRFDTDCSGTVDVEELGDIVASFGIEPLEHVLVEIIKDVDANGSGDIDVHEFYEVIKRMKKREGFSEDEYDHFFSVFNRFDRGKNGQIHVECLCQILGYMGYLVSRNVLKTCVEEVDVDLSGTLDFCEFLGCMRRIRDSEIGELRQQMLLIDTNKSGGMSISELDALVRSLGYYPDEQVVEEICLFVGLGLESELDLSKLWQFLTKYRAQEGFSSSAFDDIQKVFSMFAVPSSDTGELEVLAKDIGNILRYMGYCISFEEQQVLTTQVDLDVSGTFSCDELCKIIRMCREAELQKIRAKFDIVANLSGGSLVLSKQSAAVALQEIGCVDADGNPPAILDEELDNEGLGVNVQGFVAVARRQADANRKAARESGGFSGEELLSLKANFASFDTDGSGSIDSRELSKLVQECLPNMAFSAALRPKLVQILADAAEGDAASFTFDDFLRLMRICSEMKDNENLEKERQAIRETGFVHAEVQQFRELFLKGANKKDFKMLLSDFKTLIASVCPLGDRNDIKLTAMFCNTAKAIADDDQEPSADFSDFLRLMRAILQTNFGNVLERSKVVAEKKAVAEATEIRKPFGRISTPRACTFECDGSGQTGRRASTLSSRLAAGSPRNHRSARMKRASTVCLITGGPVETKTAGDAQRPSEIGGTPSRCSHVQG
eukprot:TRINITY_DN6920_c0_g1_i2.p1 TRINITY_DN6920_c0_g1~~TRINITY_DN6920_c0_g1_i2.p1  ORF type:complete len:1352 (-),score=237.97 TRINITY_DN6920_c0_g1_i2:102-4157(-)